jgi:pimeloyl-ACP methyl ester carboxylesterase
MPFATSQGLRIFYETEGEGPPLLLHHGTFCSSQYWRIDGFVDALKADYQIILMDARGHGQSDRPHDADAYHGPNIADDVVAVIDDLELETVHFWDFSLGARVGFVLADQAADGIDSFILGGGHPYEADVSLNLGQDGRNMEAFKNAVLERIAISPGWTMSPYREITFANDFQAVDA